MLHILPTLEIIVQENYDNNDDDIHTNKAINVYRN